MCFLLVASLLKCCMRTHEHMYMSTDIFVLWGVMVRWKKMVVRGEGRGRERMRGRERERENEGKREGERE